MLAFPQPSSVAHGSHANRPEATELGAYAVALSVVEDRYGLYAVRRAPALSGSDIIVSRDPSDALLEYAWRLEVSGTLGDQYDVRDRFKVKCNQVLAGDSELDSIVCIVGFKARLVMLERVPV